MFYTPVNSFTGMTYQANTQKNSDSVSFGIRPRPPKGLSGSAAYYYEAFVANRKTPKWLKALWEIYSKGWIRY